MNHIRNEKGIPRESEIHAVGITTGHTRIRHFGDGIFSRSGASAYRCFAHLEDAHGAVSTHLLGGCIYGFGIARQLYYTFGWKAHGDGGADTDFALQVQVTAMHFDKGLG